MTMVKKSLFLIAALAANTTFAAKQPAPSNALLGQLAKERADRKRKIQDPDIDEFGYKRSKQEKYPAPSAAAPIASSGSSSASASGTGPAPAPATGPAPSPAPASALAFAGHEKFALASTASSASSSSSSSSTGPAPASARARHEKLALMSNGSASSSTGSASGSAAPVHQLVVAPARATDKLSELLQIRGLGAQILSFISFGDEDFKSPEALVSRLEDIVALRGINRTIDQKLTIESIGDMLEKELEKRNIVLVPYKNSTKERVLLSEGTPIPHGNELTWYSGRGDSILHIAMREGNPAVIKILLYVEPYLINAKGASKRRPLMVHPKPGRADCMQILIDADVDVDACDAWGETALIQECRNASIDRTKALIDIGADVNKISRYYRETPLTLAANSLNTGCLQLLIDAGADVDAQDAGGFTALMRATESYRDDSTSSTKTRAIFAVKALIAAGANVDMDAGANVDMRARNGLRARDMALSGHMKKVLDQAVRDRLRAAEAQ